MSASVSPPHSLRRTGTGITCKEPSDMIQVRRLGHATFSTENIEREVEYWSDIMGHVVVTIARRTACSCRPSTATRRSRWSRGRRGSCKRLSFQVAPGSDLGELERNLAGHGVKRERRARHLAGRRAGGHVHRPQGHADRGLCGLRRCAPTTARDPVIAPLKFGHIAYRVNDPQKLSSVLHATCWAFACRTGSATTSRSCAAGRTTTP